MKNVPRLRAAGRFCSISLVMLAVIVVLWISTVGACPVTTTLSSTADCSRVTSRLVLTPTLTWIPSRISVLKPGSLKVTVYVPGGKAGKRQWPRSLVTVSIEGRIRAGELIETVTPGAVAFPDHKRFHLKYRFG